MPNAPVTLYPCYTPDGKTWYSGSTAPLNVLAPQITSMSVTETTRCAVNPVVLIGSFGTNPSEPTVAFSTDPQCPLASLTLRSDVVLSNNGQVWRVAVHIALERRPVASFSNTIATIHNNVFGYQNWSIMSKPFLWNPTTPRFFIKTRNSRIGHSGAKPNPLGVRVRFSARSVHKMCVLLHRIAKRCTSNLGCNINRVGSAQALSFTTRVPRIYSS